MNKVFKVIWSKTKNCYVVASELAKSYTKAPSKKGVSRVLVCGVLACVCSFGAVMPVFAAGINSYEAGGGSATGTNAVVIGHGSSGSGDNDTVIGNLNVVSNKHNTVFGFNNNVSGENNVVIGQNMNSELTSDGYNVTGTSNVLIGTRCEATYNNSVVIGDNTHGLANRSVVMGAWSVVNGNGGITLGSLSHSDNALGLTIGYSSHSSNDAGIALGAKAGSNADYSQAVGYNAKSNGFLSVSNGSASVTDGALSSTLGARSYAGSRMSVAIGAYSSTGAAGVDINKDKARTMDDWGNYNDYGYQYNDLKQDSVVSFGHKAGDAYLDDTLDADNYILNTFTDDYYRRLINVSEGIDDHDVTTVSQTGNLLELDNKTLKLKNANNTMLSNVDLSTLSGPTYTSGNHISIGNDNSISTLVDGTVSSGNTGLVSGGQVYDAIQTIHPNVYIAGNGIVINGDDNSVSVKNVIMYDSDEQDTATLNGTRGTRLTNLKAANLTQVSTDAVIGNQLWSVKQDITGFASDINRNKANITTLNQSVTDALSSVSAVSDLVDAIDSLKADASLNNLNNQGRAVIATVAANAVQDYMAEHGGATGNTNEFAKPRLMALTAPVLTADPEQGVTQENLDAKADISYVDNALANKADTSDVEALSTTVSNLETNLTGSINALDSRVSDTESALSTVIDTLDTKADKDAVYTKEETDTKLADKADKTDLDLKADKSDLDAKADKDASNIDVQAWADKLGVGEIAEGNTGLVNGEAVYNAIKQIDANNMVKSDGQTISVGTDDSASEVSIAKADGSGRVLRGVLVDPEDDTSAANVGYVNAIADNFAQGVNQGFARMDDKINKTGAGAAALANLHPIDTDGDTKLNIAAGIGRYHGETAGALGLFYKPSDRVMMNVSSTVGNNDTMFGAGVSIAVDKPVAGGMSKAQLVKAVNSQAEQIEQQNAKIQQQDAKIQQQDAVNQALLQRIIKLEQSLAEKK